MAVQNIIKNIVEILLLIIAGVAAVYLILNYAHIFSAAKKPALTPQSASSSVCFGENCFQVELAKTEAERDQGLMYRTELDKNKGMLFIFNTEGIYPFWMKNTLIPLDMIWINSLGKVVFMGQNTQPCKGIFCPSVIPPAKALYVLEINAGISLKIGIKVGDGAQINIK